MKITAVRPYPVRVGPRNQLLVKVETDEGIYGWGESGLSGRELAVVGAIEHWREWMIGRDPMQRGALWQEMYRSQYFEGGRVFVAAISAIDIALHDIAGKALNVPVYQLLGGKQRDYVPAFATTSAEPGPKMIEQAKLLVREGWNCFRLSTAGATNPDDSSYEPRESIALTSEWLIAAREALGNQPVIGVDYHHRLSVAEAASFCQMMPPHTLDFLEEPIRDESPDAYVALRSMTDIPFAIGEEFASKWQFLPYVEKGITNYARLDICNVGGFTEAMKVAGWCEAHYIDLMPHNPLGPVATAATVHLAASVTNFSWLEATSTPTGQSGFDSVDMFPVQVTLKGARYPVPQGPGLGVEVNEDLADRQDFEFWEPPHLKRSDGSYTNW